MLGILPFLIQWIALSQLGSQHFQYVQQQPSMQVPKSHWTLLNEFKQLPEEEIDHFLPQVCNMILDRESLRDDDLYDYFESVLEKKCAECFSFGTRVCGVLKATQPAPSESLFKSIYSLTSSSAAQAIRSEERLRAFQERIEYATMYGLQLSPQHSEMRSAYYRDYQFMLDTLARLGIELKSYPVALRNVHLRHALGQCNSLLYFRMASRGSVSTSDTSLQDFASFHDLSAHNIATLLPEAAQYSLHLPLHKTGDNVCRILRFVESECEVLPSRERCPYVVVVEILEQPYTTKSNLIYSHGRVPAVALSPSAQGTNRDQLMLNQVLYNGQPQLLPDSRSQLSHNHDAAQVSQSVTERPMGDISPANVYPAGQKSANKYSTPRVARGKLLSRNLSTYRSRNVNNGNNMRKYHTLNSNNNDQKIQDENANFDRADYEKAEYDTNTHSKDKDAELSELEQAYHLYDEVNNYTIQDESTAEQIQTALDALNQQLEHGNHELMTTKNENMDLFARPRTEKDHIKDIEESTENDHICELDPNHQFELSSKATQQHHLDSLRGGSVPPAAPRSDLPGEKSSFSPRVPIRRRPSVRHRRQPRALDTQNSGKAEQEARAVPIVPLSHAASVPATATSAAATALSTAPPTTTISPSYATTTSTTVATPTSTGIASTSASPLSLSSATWAERRASLQASSPFGGLPGWDAKSFIVKSGDDLRKEVLAMQVMEFCQKVFEMEGLDIYLRPYQILSTGAQAGLVEFLQGAESVDKIKKTLQAQAQALLLQQQQQQGGFTSPSPPTSPALLPTLKQYFELQFGESYSFFYAKAVKNFVKSLVGYSLLTYVVQVKDRHNSNILFDEEGHVVHIDFGFILGDSPGFNINFESAPFKLTAEYIEILGGVQSEDFKHFQDLFLKGFLALQKHVDGIASIIQLFYGDKRKAAADGVRSRLLFPQSQSDILSLIGDSLDNWRTKQYDWYQERTNNIQP